MPSRRLRARWDDRRFRQAPTTLDPAMAQPPYCPSSTSGDVNLLLMRPASPHNKRSQTGELLEPSASVSERQEALLAENDDPLSAARGICVGILLAFGLWALAGFVLWMIW